MTETEQLKENIVRMEALAKEAGLDYYPVDFEVVPPTFMMEVAVYGLPVRMPHWSFGVRYIYQLVQHRMGHSRIFEVVFPGNPGRAYLANTNTLDENTLVVAHVLGHADFAKNNFLFRRSQEQVGYRIVEQAASHAHQITSAIELHGQERVEAVLDAALSLEQYIDPHQGLRRPRYPHYEDVAAPAAPADSFQARFEALGAPGASARELTAARRKRLPTPPHPEYDLLWFIANYAPDMEEWERDIFLAVREESFYFYPVFACQIMNEGWASFWHARLLRNADFLPQQLYVEAAKTHSDVVRPYAGDRQVALSVNPYHLGFCMWEKIVEAEGLDRARGIMMEDDDFSFIRNHLTEELAEELGLFEYAARRDGQVSVEKRDLDALQEALLAPKFNFGGPRVHVANMRNDGTLELRHDYEVDGRGLDLTRAQRVLGYLHRIWRRPVLLHTVDKLGEEEVLSLGA